MLFTFAYSLFFVALFGEFTTVFFMFSLKNSACSIRAKSMHTKNPSLPMQKSCYSCSE
jgi:hypothetical protein